MNARAQWEPLGEEDLARVGEILERVALCAAAVFLIAMALTATFFRDGIGLWGSIEYEPTGAVHRTYPHDGVRDVRCTTAVRGGWTCSYRVEGKRCQATVDTGQRTVSTPLCAGRR